MAEFGGQRGCDPDFKMEAVHRDAYGGPKRSGNEGASR